MDNIKEKSLSRWWLLLGVGALAIAGLFALVLVVARTPSVAAVPMFASLFHSALVVHVDLSVLVWFVSIACMIWSLLASPSVAVIPCLEEAALVSFALGTLTIAASPLDGKGEPLMSNYIPVITSPVFFLGLSLLLCGVGLMLVKLFTSRRKWDGFGPFLRLGVMSSGVIAVVAIIGFVTAFKDMPNDFEATQYYDMLFWGGGHVLQFLHTQVLLVCWMMMMVAVKPDFRIERVVMLILFSIGFACALVAPLVYAMFHVYSVQYRDFFTEEMMMIGGVAPMLLMFYMVPALWKSRGERKGANRALWSALVMSVLLFLYGGTIGEMIRGQNVVIPAHYHGSIVGVTLGFMGMAYLFLPKFGYRDVSSWRLAYWQPFVLGGGQLLHVSGLAWSGGYGVLRKTPGGLEALPMSVKIAMGFMGLGGVIAIAGGLMFVIVMWRSVSAKN